MASRAGTSVRPGNSTEWGDIRKALFKSPGGEPYSSPDTTEMLMNRLQIEHDVESSLKILQKDQHEQRLKQLRQLQKTISEDNWMYTPAEKLTGLQ